MNDEQQQRQRDSARSKLCQVARDFYVSPPADDAAYIELLEAAFEYAAAWYGEIDDAGISEAYKGLVARRRNQQ